MRLITFRKADNTEFSLGALSGEQVVDLKLAAECSQSASPHLASMQSFIEGGEQSLSIARKLMAQQIVEATLPVSQIRLTAPLPLPVQIRDFSCFEEHVRNAPVGSRKILEQYGNFSRLPPAPVPGAPPPETFYRQPTYYKANRYAVSGPDDEVIWPVASSVMDYELELAMVIGQTGRNISRDRAADHIFGFMIFNDFSARDLQAVEMLGRLGPAKGKDFDGANAFGPCLVTKDEIPDPQNLKMVAKVNGEIWSEGSSADMHWTFNDLIEHVSRDETLHPGEIFGSGTVGLGCGLEHGRYLSDGDQVELEIEHIGILRNKVVRR